MTDPLALEPVLPEPERRALHADEGLPHDARYEAFVVHVRSGGSVDATHWVPD